jgi:hypothetical protein
MELEDRLVVLDCHHRLFHRGKLLKLQFALFFIYGPFTGEIRLRLNSR